MAHKTQALAREWVARVALDKLSKNALADLVVDLLRQNLGDEHLDGEPLARAVAAAWSPVASVRGDAKLNVDSIVKDYAERLAKREAGGA